MVKIPTDELERELWRKQGAIIRMKRLRQRCQDPEKAAELRRAEQEIGEACKTLRRRIAVREGLRARA